MNGNDEIEQMEGIQETEEQKLNRIDVSFDAIKEKCETVEDLIKLDDEVRKW